MTRTLTALSVIALAGGTALAGDIVKPPNVGANWQPLDPDTGTYIYANLFVADESGPVDELGTWLLAQGGAGTGAMVAFEVYGSVGGDATNGPDSTNVIASTGLLDIGGGTDTLDFYSAAAAFSGNLTAGEIYWFGANVIGGGPADPYEMGQHEQNSIYDDNGTFWFSNDPTGVNFDGQNFTPEIAFSVSIVPAPGAVALLGLGGIAAIRRRR